MSHAAPSVRAVSKVSAMGDTPTFEHRDYQPEAPGRGGTWPSGAPPMRLNRPITKSAHPSAAESATDQEPPATSGAQPGGLRLLRALIGMALLALAWGGFLIVANLGTMALGGLTTTRPSAHTLLYLAEILGALWIAAIAVCCIIAGAFSLTLAITNASFE